jgi:hypothetical protein
VFAPTPMASDTMAAAADALAVQIERHACLMS